MSMNMEQAAKLPPPETKEVQLARARQQVAEAQERQRQLEAQGSNETENETDEDVQARLDAAAAEIERELETTGASSEPEEATKEVLKATIRRSQEKAVEEMAARESTPKRRAGRPRKSESVAPELGEVPAVILTGATVTTLNLPVDLPFKEWKTYATYLRVLDKGTHWWLGDLMLYADLRGKEWEEQGIQYLAELGFSDQTLLNDKSVCKAFSSDPPFSGGKPVRKRHDKLSFEHHKMVAFLEPKLAEELLHRSEVGDGRGNPWTTQELKDEIRVRRANKAMEPPKRAPKQRKVADGIDRSLRSEPPSAHEEMNGTGPVAEFAGGGGTETEFHSTEDDTYDFAAHTEVVSRARMAMTNCQLTLEKEKLEQLEPGYAMTLGAIEVLCELRDSYERLGLGD